MCHAQDFARDAKCRLAVGALGQQVSEFRMPSMRAHPSCTLIGAI
jgi:hypothetical protein